MRKIRLRFKTKIGLKKYNKRFHKGEVAQGHIFHNLGYREFKMRSKEFLYSLGENIFIEFLPPYSPQLNCIETCWKIIRYNVTNSNWFQSIENLQAGVEEFLQGYFFMLNPSNYLIR